MTTDYYTENLADFGARERAIAAELLSAPLPDTFNNSGVKLAFNKNSGNVFLVNEDYQCAMMNGDSLEVHHSTPYDGHEGFISDLLDLFPVDLNLEDARYILEAATAENVTLPENWQKFADGETSSAKVA